MKTKKKTSSLEKSAKELANILEEHLSSYSPEEIKKRTQKVDKLIQAALKSTVSCVPSSKPEAHKSTSQIPFAARTRR